MNEKPDKPEDSDDDASYLPDAETLPTDLRYEYELLRKKIGEDVVLSDEERSEMLKRYFKGELGLEVKDRRTNHGLRHALGDNVILEPEQRKTILQIIKSAVQQFFTAGVHEGEPTHVEKLGLTKQKKSFLSRIGRG